MCGDVHVTSLRCIDSRSEIKRNEYFWPETVEKRVYGCISYGYILNKCLVWMGIGWIYCFAWIYFMDILYGYIIWIDCMHKFLWYIVWI